MIETNAPRTITEPLISPSVLNAGLAVDADALAKKLCSCLECEERAWARVAELEDVILALLPAFSNDTATAAQLRTVYADTILKAEELTANVKLRGTPTMKLEQRPCTDDTRHPKMPRQGVSP